MSDAPPKDYDVLIIGAGINGAGLFRDLCAQGLRCLIVDKGDFGSGTSAAPSRLIHGGLKYLETGEFRLVAEATYERNLLLCNAAHLVRPLPTLIPIQSWTKGIGAAVRTFFGSTTAPRSRGALLIKIGLRLYDFYGSRARRMPRHRMLSRTQALAEMPALTPNIVAVGTYYDAAISAPERLVLELVQDGLAAEPTSTAMNWTSVDGQCEGLVDITGPDGNHHHVRPKIVVNAAGPWIDGVNAVLGLETTLIGGTKGSHIVLDHPELLRQLNGRMIYFEGDDGRILLVFPYLDKALVGSTDIPASDPDAVVCEADEISYFMDSLSTLLPGLTFDRRQIVYTYSGLRPLPKSIGLAPGLISRDHSAPIHAVAAGRPFPVMSLVGGKWTTFRAFAEQAANVVLAQLDQGRSVSTSELPIGGGRDMPEGDAARAAWIEEVTVTSGALQDRVAVLLDRYGTTARAVAQHEGASSAILQGAAETSGAEIDWISRHESVHHLEDIVLRRTQLAITGHLSYVGLNGICSIAAKALGWDKARANMELERVRNILEKRHGVHLWSRDSVRPAAMPSGNGGK